MPSSKKKAGKNNPFKYNQWIKSALYSFEMCPLNATEYNMINIDYEDMILKVLIFNVDWKII